MQLAVRKDIGAPAGGGGPGLRVAGGGQGAGLWDVAQPGMAAQHQPPDAFSEIVAGSNSGVGTGKILGILLAVVLAAAGGYFAYEWFVNDQNPIDAAEKLYHSGLVLAGVEEETAPGSGIFKPKRAKKPAAATTATKPKSSVRPGIKALDGNPYWSLPNSILGNAPEMNRPWTAEEEETWRAGLAHRFTYQRYKTIMDVRDRRLKGSEAILWDALTEKKYWTRASAAVGLANFNIQISLQTLEQAIGKERSEITADFFERLAVKPTTGEAFVLRQAVRLLDEKGRLVVLKGIWRTNDDLRDLYIAAATIDPGRRIQRWVHSALAAKPIQPDRYNMLMAVVRGEASVDNVLKGAARRQAPGVDKKAKKGVKAPVETVVTETQGAAEDGGDADESGSDQFADFDHSTGDVEIYDAKGPVTDDVPDASTFDYKDK